MAIIVNKDKKREEIALSCKDLIIKEGINNLTISAIAKEANIGKGTFYEYFSNKYELVFELVSIMLREYNKVTEQKLKEAKSIEEKLKLFAKFYYDKHYSELRALYNQFIAISIISPNKEMLEFQTKCFNKYKEWLVSILEQEVKSNNLPSKVVELADMLFVSVDGLYITSITTNAIKNLQKEIDSYIEKILNLIKD